MLMYKVGSTVLWRGDQYRITRIVDLYNCLGVSIDSEEIVTLPIKELSAVKDPPKPGRPTIDLSLLSDDELKVAEQRYTIIKPLLALRSERRKKDVEKVAKEHNLDTTTLYRWIRRYEASGKLSSLINLRRNDKGGSRLDADQEAILKIVINDYYLQLERPTIEDGWLEYKSKCQQAGIKACSRATFARRVELIAPKETALKRNGPRVAHEKYDPATEEFPYGKFPLHAVQIDHTQPNIILVDDIYRKPIGRPWVTFAIDTFSRMILGFYLSLSPPSAFSVGMCIVFAMCRKEKWLAQRGIDVDYPVWGMFDRVFADNGPDFRCNAVSRSCEEHSIDLHWRPLNRTEYGGHIERLMRTVKTDMGNLKGSTFKNPLDRGEYDSEGRAIFTFAEFERWLTVYICKFYHMRKHSKIDMPPIKKYEEGLFSDIFGRSTGLPDPIKDERRLYLDFLPYIERTIPRSGVLYENVRYFHPSITKWIGVKPPYGDKHIFKYEEHQISHLYYLDPDTQDYLEIPRVRRDAPQMTRFELRKARKRVIEKGKASVDEQALIDAHRELSRIQAESEEKTKAARRGSQRKKESIRARAHIEVDVKIPERLQVNEMGFSDETVDAYEDI